MNVNGGHNGYAESRNNPSNQDGDDFCKSMITQVIAAASVVVTGGTAAGAVGVGVLADAGRKLLEKFD